MTLSEADEATALFTPAERARLRSDFEYFCNRMLWINPKIKELVKAREEGEDASHGGALIRFRWNLAQRYVWQAMCAMIARGVPVKLVILKARQVGISTFFCAYLFWQMWRQRNYRSAIVAYEKKTTLAELNETMATFYDSLPPGYRPRLRQHHARARVNKEDMYFDDRKSNMMFVVQKPNALRGVARDGVLTTEVAFYKDAEDFYGGFLPSMSDSPNALLILESSPEDGYFKDAYDLAKSGTTDRMALFIPWWMVTDLYTRPVVRKGRGTFDKAEPDVAIRFEARIRAKQKHLSRMAAKRGLPPVTDEQMWWWVWKCRSDYQGDEEWMQQEFPDDDVTAFQKASRSAFKVALPAVSDTVNEIDTLFPNVQVGLLRSSTYYNNESEQIVEFEPEPRPNWIDQERRPGLLMLEEPNPKYTYVVGADVADEEGEDDEEGERAFSVGCVYCCDTRNQVAEWRGHLDPTDWGDELVKLGYFYNCALLVVERNNMGRLTEHRIRSLRYPPHRRFRWPDFNVGPHSLTKKEMWETNATTKIMMIGALRQWIRDGLFRVRTPGLQEELTHYRVVKGKFMAKDRPADRIIAAALCVQGVEQTEFAYRNIVLSSPHIENRGASGMAARILKKTKVPPKDETQLPEELAEILRPVDGYKDIFAAAGF